jgi:S1-C subfamily serine protease
MKRLLGAAVAAGMVLLTGSPAFADGETEPEAPESTELAETSGYVGPSLVYIQSTFEAYIFDPFNGQYLNDGQPFTYGGRCTGYVVNPDGYIATAGHCVDNLGRGGGLQDALLYAGAQWAIQTGYYGAGTFSSPEEILASETYELEGAADGDFDPDLVSVEVSWPADASGSEIGETAVAEVIDWHPITEDDAALLKVNLDGLYPLPLSDGENVDVGTPVVAVGFPGSVDEVTSPTLNASYKDGTVSSLKTNQAGTGDVYEHSAAVSGGMSGGPVVNLDNEVIGFNSFGPASETQAFNFSGPADAIQQMMQQAGVENELGPLAEQYRAGLDALYAGDREAAIAAFEGVLDEDRTNPYATEYLDQAQDLPAGGESGSESGSDSGGFPILWVAIGAGALVLIGLVLFLALRKKPASPSAHPTAPSVPGVAAWPPAGQAQQPYQAQAQQPYQQPAPQAYPPAPAPAASPQVPVPPPPSPAPGGFDPNKTTYVGQAETPYIPQQQGQTPHQGQPPRQ